MIAEKRKLVLSCLVCCFLFFSFPAFVVLQGAQQQAAAQAGTPC